MITTPKRNDSFCKISLMSAYFCPHSVFNSGYLIEFMCLMSDLIDNFDN